MAPETFHNNHRDVDNRKKNEQEYKHEVERSSGLMTSDYGRQKWEYGRDPERHAETRPDNAGKNHEHDPKICQPL